NLLSMFGDSKEEADEKPVIGKDELSEVIETIREFVEQFDYDSLGYVFEELAEYRMPENIDGWMEKVKAAAMKPDWDEAKRLLNEESRG
ncbi:MAG: hypothetical protein K6E80_02205, partial [Schwartzia sp.]|nr:hypothetical protein [Schwartzia sp. (in: firmicutes)]